MELVEVPVLPRLLDVLAAELPASELRAAEQAAQSASKLLSGRTVWNVNSTPVGGGVAELLRSLLPYVRGAGIDARWLVMRGGSEFFRITKRLHHALHGTKGDGSRLGREERAIYEQTLAENGRALAARVRSRDLVILHDPQTAGLAPGLVDVGAQVIWRCHIGSEEMNEELKRGWTFLLPYLERVSTFVFSRQAYIPELLDHGESVVISPSIDPFSAKNAELNPDSVRAILVHVGIVEGPAPSAAPTFTRSDGSVRKVEHKADLIRMGRAPSWETPLVVQVSRWDSLKDPVGVMLGFASLTDRPGARSTELVLAGPNVHAVADDPEGDLVFRQVLDAWRGLPHKVRDQITLASLPTSDVEENAAIVNALQRHATIVVQKSLREGFGLTVAEAMWKERPVVASGVGGIRDQIKDGVSGVLLADPSDLDAFADALCGLLDNPKRAQRIGRAARERVRERFLGVRPLMQYQALLTSLAS